VRVPSSLKPIIVTVLAAPAGAGVASAKIEFRPNTHHNVAPTVATPAPTKNDLRSTNLLSGIE
jgi:hypothetical protein